jgi:hypothetical protein
MVAAFACRVIKSSHSEGGQNPHGCGEYSNRIRIYRQSEFAPWHPFARLGIGLPQIPPLSEKQAPR